MNKNFTNVVLIMFITVCTLAGNAYASKKRLQSQSTIDLKEVDSFGMLFGERYKIFLDESHTEKNIKGFRIRDKNKPVDWLGDSDELYRVEVDSVNARFLYMFEEKIPFDNVLIGSFLVEATILCAGESPIEKFLDEGRALKKDFSIESSAYISNYFSETLDNGLVESNKLQSLVSVFIQKGKGMVMEISKAYYDDEFYEASKPLEKKYIFHDDLRSYADDVCGKFYPFGAEVRRSK